MDDKQLIQSVSPHLNVPLDEVWHAIRNGTFAAHEDVPRLCAALEEVRSSLSPREWQQSVRQVASHPAIKRIREDPFTHRCCAKPRGYAGDALMLDFIYGHPSTSADFECATALGREICAYTTSGPASQAVFERRSVLANAIHNAISKTDGSARILSIACGHLREVELLRQEDLSGIRKLIAMDQDAETLSQLAKDYPWEWLMPVQASVSDVLAGKIIQEQFDLVYAAGLFDYLTDKLCIRLLRKLTKVLAPGGRLLAANFLHGIGDRGYMECCMDWWLTYRTEEEMRSLGVRGGLIPSITLDTSRQIVYLEHTRDLEVE